jgi:hypothetical protein
MLNRHALQVDSFEAANIDRSRRAAFGIDSFRVWVNATGGAKAMFDNVLVESVRADVCFRCEQVQLIPRDKPEERSFA